MNVMVEYSWPAWIFVFKCGVEKCLRAFYCVEFIFRQVLEASVAATELMPVFEKARNYEVIAIDEGQFVSVLLLIMMCLFTQTNLGIFVVPCLVTKCRPLESSVLEERGWEEMGSKQSGACRFLGWVCEFQIHMPDGQVENENKCNEQTVRAGWIWK